MSRATTPPLTADELRVGRVFGPHPTTVGGAELAAYTAVTGEPTDPAADVPPGLVGVLARRAYLAEHSMPPGGVMLGQDLVFRRPIPAAVELTLSATVEHTGTRRGRPYVEIRSVITEGASVCAEVVTRAQWPGGADA